MPIEPSRVEAMAEFADQMATILEMVIGYRKQAETGGIGSVAADTMAAQLHGELIAIVFRNVNPKNDPNAR